MRSSQNQIAEAALRDICYLPQFSQIIERKGHQIPAIAPKKIKRLLTEHGLERAVRWQDAYDLANRLDGDLAGILAGLRNWHFTRSKVYEEKGSLRFKRSYNWAAIEHTWSLLLAKLIAVADKPDPRPEIPTKSFLEPAS